MNISNNLKQYISLLKMEGYKPVTHSDHIKFANNVVNQIKEDYEVSLWPKVFHAFVSQVDIKLRPYLYESKNQLK